MLDFLVEQRLAEAIGRGELDNLPGAGRPLELDDDPLVPEELRLADRILKNAGYVPPELGTLNEIAEFERLVTTHADDAGRARAVRKLALLKTRVEARYYEKTLNRLSGR